MDSNNALVRMVARTKLSPDSGCWEWQGASTRQGYGRFRFNGSLVSPHRLVFELFNRPLTDGECVLHRCDNPRCINPGHLFAGTSFDNMQDCAAKGRINSQVDPSFTQGERRKNAKLTDDTVREIRQAAVRGETKLGIAKRYGVARSVVQRVIKGTRWKHVL